jgi:Flp pilus assembly protein TadD
VGRAGGRFRGALAGATVAVVAVAAFLPALTGGFVWDDDLNVLTNPHIRGLSGANLTWMFTESHAGHYQPLTWLSYTLDYALWGMAPGGYHLTNLLLHALNAVLLLVLCLRLGRWINADSQADTRSQAEAAGNAAEEANAPATPNNSTANAPASVSGWYLVAASVAVVLFAVHPMRVESVAWVTERRDVLSASLGLGAVLAYLTYVRRRGWYWFAATFGLLLAALLARAGAMVLPFVLLLLDAYPLRRLGYTRELHDAEAWSDHRRWPRLRTVLLEKAVLLIPCVVVAALAAAAQVDTGATASLTHHPLGDRLLQAAYGLAYYLAKTAWPMVLSPIYELHLPWTWDEPRHLLSLVAVGLAVVVLLIRGRRRPGWVVLAACYALLLAPVLGLLQSGSQEVADRYSYTALMPWTVALAIVLGRWCRDGADKRRRRMIVVAAGVMLAAGLGVRTWQYTRVWGSPLSLWTHAVERGPASAIAARNLGHALLEVDRPAEAREAFALGRRLKPRELHLEHAQLLLADGAYQAAISDLEPLTAWHPEAAALQRLLARAYAGAGELEAARRQYVRALKLEPRDRATRQAYIELLQRLGADQEAARQRQILAAVEPSESSASGTAEEDRQRVVTLMELGDFAGATGLLRARLEREPKDDQAWYLLGQCQLGMEQFAAAREAFRQATELKPEVAIYHNELGRVLGLLDDPSGAAAAYRAAVRLEPELLAAQYNLGIVLAHLGEFEDALTALEHAHEIATRTGRTELLPRIEARIERVRTESAGG